MVFLHVGVGDGAATGVCVDQHALVVPAAASKARSLEAPSRLVGNKLIQAPGQQGEDTTGGFQHGGWHVGYFDDIAQRWVVDSVVKAGGFLLGRRTYEIFVATGPTPPRRSRSWPSR